MKLTATKTTNSVGINTHETILSLLAISDFVKTIHLLNKVAGTLFLLALYFFFALSLQSFVG